MLQQAHTVMPHTACTKGFELQWQLHIQLQNPFFWLQGTCKSLSKSTGAYLGCRVSLENLEQPGCTKAKDQAQKQAGCK